MNEEQKVWLEKVRLIAQDALSGKIPTYEDAVNDLEVALETCPEP